MKSLRVALAGFGVVGRGFVELLKEKQEYLRQVYELDVRLVGLGNARHGFIYREEGLDLPTLHELGVKDETLIAAEYSHHWSSTLKGLQKGSADVLVEVTPTNMHDAEPGLSHIATALREGMHVVTANKGPGALAGLDLLALARQQGVQLRMESSVMAGTPVLSTLLEGMAGAKVQSIRGILNGTTNFILTSMAGSKRHTYDEAVAEAKAKGYAESDPTADVEGYDAMAKTLILAALVFHQQLKPEQVERRGITTIVRNDLDQAINSGKRIKLLSTIQRDGDQLKASVALHELPVSDALARVEGITNALVIKSDTLPEVTIIGPGAGAIATAQGLLADVIACAR